MTRLDPYHQLIFKRKVFVHVEGEVAVSQHAATEFLLVHRLRRRFANHEPTASASSFRVIVAAAAAAAMLLV